MCAKKVSVKDDSTSVITVRIDKNLNETLDNHCRNLRISKANLIRSYLEMSKYLIVDRGAIKSLDNRELIILKQSYLKKNTRDLDEIRQIEMGEKLARYVNDIARIEGKLDDLSYKLDLCEHMGYFPRFIDKDKDKFILFSKKFGTQKFVEAFVWQLINQSDYNRDFLTEEIERSKSIRGNYNKTINPVERSSSHYSFGYAKLPEVKEE